MSSDDLAAIAIVISVLSAGFTGWQAVATHGARVDARRARERPSWDLTPSTDPYNALHITNRGARTVTELRVEQISPSPHVDSFVSLEPNASPTDPRLPVAFRNLVPGQPVGVYVRHTFGVSPAPLTFRLTTYIGRRHWWRKPDDVQELLVTFPQAPFAARI